MATVEKLKTELDKLDAENEQLKKELTHVRTTATADIAEKNYKIADQEAKILEQNAKIAEQEATRLEQEATITRLRAAQNNTPQTTTQQDPQVNQSNVVQNNNHVLTTSIGFIEPYEIKEDWSQWLERFEHYMAGNMVLEERKKALFLNLLGKEGFALVKSLCAPDTPKDKPYAELVRVMSNHLKPKPSIIAERFKFNMCNQLENQTVSEYLANLKKLSTYCEFGTNLSDIMRDRFVCGLKNKTIKKKLLSEKNLTYERAVELALSEETATRDTGEMESKLTNGSINYIKRQRGNDNSTAEKSNQCKCCGKKGHDKFRCRYRNLECNVCKKKGHLSFVCRVNKTDKSNSKETDYHKSSNNTRNTKRNVGMNERVIDKRNDKQNYIDEMYQINEDFDTMYTLNECNTNEYKVTDNDEPYCVDIFVETGTITFELDTGSSVTAISQREYETNAVFKDLQLVSTDRRFKSYVENPMMPIGKLQVKAKYKDKTADLEIIVMPGSAPPIVGRQWIRVLGILLTEVKSSKNKINNIEVDKGYDLDRLKREFPTVLTDKLGLYNQGTVKYMLKDDFTPVFQRPRTLPYSMTERVEEELNRLLKEDIIEPVKYSDWATPIVPVVKSNGQIRLCGDYKVTVNKYLHVNRHPLPKPEDLRVKLNRGKIFSAIDLSNAYLQLGLDEKSKLLTTITTHKGLFVFKRATFGIASNPGLFQDEMEKTLHGIEGVAVFSDNVVISGSTKEEHDKRLIEVLNRLKRVGLTVKLEKCEFFKSEVNFLGYKISGEGISVIPEKVEAICKIPPPENITQLRSFLGMTNYYSKFIKNYADIVAPMYVLLRKDVKWCWSRECNDAFVKIKEKLLSTEVRAHYNPELPIKVTCDASPIGVGAVISHIMPNNEIRPIAFNSRALTKAEQNYSQLDREALAIVFAVKTFHQYLYGRRFLLETDHKPLKFIFGEKKGLPAFAASRMQRWAVFLAGYNYELQHIKGVSNKVADYLSRAPKLSGEERVLNEYTYLDYIESDVKTIDCDLICSETEKDTVLSKVLYYVMNGWPSKVDEELETFKRRERELTVERGCLMWGYRVIIPTSLRQMMLRELHLSHMGVVKMKAVARSYIWWPGLDGDIEKVSKSCKLCLENSTNPARSTLHNWKWPEGPNQRLHIDFCGPVDGRMYLIILDAHSKWLDAKEMKDITSRTTIIAMKEYFRTWGYPEVIVSDNGPSLVSEEFEEFLANKRILHIKTAPYHPSSNGAAENAVKTFKSKMKVLMKSGLNREEALHRFLISYRSTPHCTTNCTPAELQLGRPMRTQMDLVRPNLRNQVLKQQRQQQQHAVGNRQCKFSNGETVMAKDVMRGTWTQAKIIEQLSPVTFTVLTNDDRLWKRHVDQLKPCLLEGTTNMLQTPERDARNDNILGSSYNGEVIRRDIETSQAKLNNVQKTLVLNDQLSSNQSVETDVTETAQVHVNSEQRESTPIPPTSQLSGRSTDTTVSRASRVPTTPSAEPRRSSRVRKPVERLNL